MKPLGEDKVLHTLLMFEDPRGMDQPFLSKDQRHPALRLMEVVHTTRDYAGYKAALDELLRILHREHPKTKDCPSHLPCSRSCLADFVMTDCDLALLNALSVVLNGMWWWVHTCRFPNRG